MEAPAELAHRRARIVTLTMNPVLDITTSVDTVRPTEKLRCETRRYDPGGGGINVVGVARVLGGSVSAVFPAGGPTGDLVKSLVNRFTPRSGSPWPGNATSSGCGPASVVRAPSSG
jgi:6-phosphofructokinase 2